MTNKETIDKEQFHQNLERFKIVLETRNFEIELFWKRCNYFLVLNTALAVGIFASFNGNGANKVFLPWICLVGVFVCFAWIKVGLGSKFWQSHWEQVVEKTQEDIGFNRGDGGKNREDYFSQEDAEDASDENASSRGGPSARVKDNLRYKGDVPDGLGADIRDSLALCLIPANRKGGYHRCVLIKPSVSRWMHRTALFFLWAWMLGGFWALSERGFWAWLLQALCKVCN